jgi:hypothetical protein
MIAIGNLHHGHMALAGLQGWWDHNIDDWPYIDWFSLAKLTSPIRVKAMII